MAYLTLFRRKFPKNSRKKSQRSGRGGWVKPVGTKSQLLPKICFACFPKEMRLTWKHDWQSSKRLRSPATRTTRVPSWACVLLPCNYCSFPSFPVCNIFFIFEEPEFGLPSTGLPSKILPLQCLDLCPSPSRSFLRSPSQRIGCAILFQAHLGGVDFLKNTTVAKYKVLGSLWKKENVR